MPTHVASALRLLLAVAAGTVHVAPTPVYVPLVLPELDVLT
jgi:hypothetical protein